MPLNSRLENNANVIILYHLQVPIKFSHQPKKHYAFTVVEISLVICLDNISNNVQMSHYDICSDYIPFKDSLSILYSGLDSNYAFFCHLTDSALRSASRHSSTKKNIQIVAKNNTNKILLVPQKKNSTL
jgi:hypothetical protein